jgi:opacity protein-like surface antigen
MKERAMRVLGGLLIGGALLFSAGEAAAVPWFWGVTYQMAQPTGDTREFTDDFSFWNLGAEGRAAISENMSAGVFFGWNSFYEDVNEVISFDNIDISGPQLRHVNAIPMLANFNYYFGQPSGLMPFIGAGVGTYWIENQMEISTVSFTNSNWHFGLAPEVGVTMRIGQAVRGLFNVRYNYAFEADDITHSYWTFGFGIFPQYRY